jgi:DNA-binding transcriptional regulator YiaG
MITVEIRKKLNLTQEEFAKLIGVHKQTVSKWETNKSKPTKSMLKALSIMKERLDNGQKLKNEQINITDFRFSAMMTQEALAEKLEASTRTIQRWKKKAPKLIELTVNG